MNHRQAFSTQSRVRGLLKAINEPMRLVVIRDRLGFEGDLGYARINKAVGDLVKRGEVKKYAPGRYRWVGAVPDTEYCKKQKRMQRVMWIRSKKGEPFTARKIHELAECSIYLAKEYVTFLRKKGFIYQAGRARTTGRGYASTYLAVEEKLNSEWPVMRKQGKTAIIDECIEKLQALAVNFFRMEDISRETLLNLLTTTVELAVQVRKCEKIALGLRKNGVHL